MKWDEYFINQLPNIAAKSKDPHTQLGCIIVGPDHEIRTTGFNSFPRGLNDNVPARKRRPEKYFWMVHAERNAIFNAARIGTALLGCTCYISIKPCVECAHAIIQSGIKNVVFDKKQWEEYSSRQNPTGNTWFHQVRKAASMLKECGVKVRAYK